MFRVLSELPYKNDTTTHHVWLGDLLIDRLQYRDRDRTEYYIVYRCRGRGRHGGPLPDVCYQFGKCDDEHAGRARAPTQRVSPERDGRPNVHP